MEGAKERRGWLLTLSLGGTWWTWIFAWLHPGVIVVASLALAVAIFLSGAERHALVGSEAALFKLLAGTALLFLLGVFFTQRLTIRQRRARLDSELERGSAELAAMKMALEKHIRQKSANSA
jgi:hypothetical protein